MEKSCNNCKRVLPLSEFGTQKGGKFGLNGRCRECVRVINKERYKVNPESFKRNAQRHFEKNPESRTNSRLKYVFGITLKEYKVMLDQQSNKCAICKDDQSSFTRLFDVDHCHTTGRIRGLLCAKCNKALGLFKDDPEVLKNAINYLKT